MKNYDFAHLQKMVLTEHRVKRIYEQAIDDFMRIYDWMEQPQDEMETLRFDKQPILRPHVAKIMQRLRRGVNVVVTDGIKASWMLSQEKNNELTRAVFGRAKAKKLSPQQLKAFFTRSEEGLQAFLSRKVAGLNFSERVWKLTDGFKEEMEMAIELGMREGRSADDLSRDIRQYLQQPDMLFRRIRDKSTGMFRLSKRAAAYHPGRGVYRSSYKNARRLAGTEMNMAYRTADHERWQQLDFVVGFEVRLSNNHTELNRQGKAVRFHDMCDELQGRYPKTFKFVGWHPHCRCFAVPILKTEEEMARDTELILAGKEPSEESANTVQEMPKAFEEWMEKNKDRTARALAGKLQMPLFIKDNFVEGNPEKGYVWEEEKKPLSLLEKAKLRHEARTPEQEEDIRKRWEERKAKLVDKEKEGKGYQRVTLEELKAQMGDSLPKTLRNLDKATDKYERTAKYGLEARRHKEEVESVMREIFATHDYGMNVESDVLDAILDSYFKNTFETGTSGGYLGSTDTTGLISLGHKRLPASHKLFGISKKTELATKQLERGEYEKYGNLLGRDIEKSLNGFNRARQYGYIEVRFKKHKVITTWTAGDSLGMHFQPSLCSDPKACSYDSLTWELPLRGRVNVEDMEGFRSRCTVSYLELQFHGHVGIDCVDSLAFPYDLHNEINAHHLARAQRWKEAGVKVYFTDANKKLQEL